MNRKLRKTYLHVTIGTYKKEEVLLFDEIDFINEQLTSFRASGCCNHHPGVDTLKIVIIIQAFIISANSEAIKDNLR